KAVQRMQCSPDDDTSAPATISNNVGGRRPANPGPHAGIAKLQGRHNPLGGAYNIRHSYPRSSEAPTHHEGNLTLNNGLDELGSVDWCMLRVHTTRQELTVDWLMDAKDVLVRLTGEAHLLANHAVTTRHFLGDDGTLHGIAVGHCHAA